jgi:hypothetical protein
MSCQATIGVELKNRIPLMQKVLRDSHKLVCFAHDLYK